MGRAVLINPNLVFQQTDLFTTGIVYMPVGLASFAGALRAAGVAVEVLDAFAERPNQWFKRGPLIFRGLTPEETASRLPADTSVIGLYAINLTYHVSLIEILKRMKRRFPNVPVVILENTQAVTAYALGPLEEEFRKAGADYVLRGEMEVSGTRLMQALLQGDAASAKAIESSPAKETPDLNELPFPAWDLFPLKNYWSLRYAHGPQSAPSYLPILTSRGCPYPCRFCVIPATNNRRWRGRDAARVVDEMAYLQERFGVNELHIEDVDPTIDDERIRAICREIIRRQLKLRWKICAGTKVETIRDEETLELMHKAGFRYLSISPESGSPRMLKLMKKPFNLDHAKRIIRKASALGIRSQACFVVGFPGEEEADRELTANLVKDLSRFGIDEIAVFMVTPVPGSDIFTEMGGYQNYSELTFSPTWRPDYQTINRFRLRLYATFLWNKLLFHPIRLLAQPFRFLAQRFETKMEMVPYRALHMWFLQHGLAGQRTEYVFDA